MVGIKLLDLPTFEVPFPKQLQLTHFVAVDSFPHKLVKQVAKKWCCTQLQQSLKDEGV